jgi:hypothetical protein
LRYFSATKSATKFFILNLSVLKNLSPAFYLSLLALSGLYLASLLLRFNGLYGQDAHEYYRQAIELHNRMQGIAAAAPGLGEAQFSGGYPFAAALLMWIIPYPTIALQTVSLLSAALSVWFFYQCLRLLSPGAHAKSRVVFTILTLMLAPYFVRAGMSSMSDGLGLALMLGSLYRGLRVVYKGRVRDAVIAVILMGFAVTTRYAMGVLLLPLVAAMLLTLWRYRNFGGILAMLIAGILSILPHFWLKNGAAVEMDRHWSLWYFFQNTFITENGTSHYTLPNILYVFFPLAHPGFCLLLPGLLLLSKKTDIVLPSKKVLIACLVCYLLLLGGLPHQNLRFLLPAYAILLLLFFPAWDRMFAYGFYFFKRLTWSILALVLAVQIISTAYILKPTLQRAWLEHDIAWGIPLYLKLGNATVYTFDLDIALQTYYPDIHWKNMWIQRYDTFPAGSYVLFNEPLLRPQWEGKNPILNWDHMNETHLLQLVQELPGGWNLYLMNRLNE